MVDPFTPSRRLLYRDYTVLSSAPDGTISHDPEGLYDHDTRVLSRHRLTIDGQELRFVSSADLAADRRLTVLLAPRTGGSASGPVLPQDDDGSASHEILEQDGRLLIVEAPSAIRRARAARAKGAMTGAGAIRWRLSLQSRLSDPGARRQLGRADEGLEVSRGRVATIRG